MCSLEEHFWFPLRPFPLCSQLDYFGLVSGPSWLWHAFFKSLTISIFGFKVRDAWFFLSMGHVEVRLLIGLVSILLCLRDSGVSGERQMGQWSSQDTNTYWMAMCTCFLAPQNNYKTNIKDHRSHKGKTKMAKLDALSSALPWTHRNYNHIQKSSLSEKMAWNWQNIPSTPNIEKEPHWEGQEQKRGDLVGTLWPATLKWKGHHKLEHSA